MTNLIEQWLSTHGFMLHGHYSLWTPELMWANVISEAAIGLAYYSIPLTLLTLVRRRRDLQFTWIFVMFSAFIFACGTTHFFAIWNIWHPADWLDAALKFVTAIISVATAAMLWPLVLRVIRLPSPQRMREAIDQLEHQIDERKKAEDALRESQATLRELAAYQERIREDERKRIAREIHDELGQNLLALRLDVSALQVRAGERHPRLRERAETALEYIDTTMKSIRSIMNNLRPAVLDLGLQAAIEWQVAQFERRHNLICEIVMSDEGKQISETQATSVFRVLQESLNNIGRHARATFVRIEVRVDNQQLKLVVKDDGVGMHPSDRRKAHRFGLIGMEERISMLGGEMRIDSTPGQGTVLRVTVPLVTENTASKTARA